MGISREVTLEFEVRAPLSRADLDGLSRRVCRLLAAVDPVVAFCDVASFEHVDAVTVDALARLQLLARQRGCRIRLRGAGPQLRDLLALMGLEDVLPEA